VKAVIKAASPELGAELQGFCIRHLHRIHNRAQFQRIRPPHREGTMKNTAKFAFAAFMLTLTLTALPHIAAASTTTPPPPTALKEQPNDSEHKDWIVIIVNLTSLLPL
jgi:hypothetical protein